MRILSLFCLIVFAGCKKECDADIRRSMLLGTWDMEIHLKEVGLEGEKIRDSCYFKTITLHEDGLLEMSEINDAVPPKAFQWIYQNEPEKVVIFNNGSAGGSAEQSYPAHFEIIKNKAQTQHWHYERSRIFEVDGEPDGVKGIQEIDWKLTKK